MPSWHHLEPRPGSVLRLWPFFLAVAVAACGGPGPDEQARHGTVSGALAGKVTAQPFLFYANGALQNGWWDNSWTTRTVNSTAVLDGADHTLSVTYSAWSALALYAGTAASVSGLDAFSLAINVQDNATPSITARLQSGGSWRTTRAIGSYCTLPRNTWVVCRVPLADLGVTGGTVTGVLLAEGAGRNLTAVALDDLQLTASAPPPTCTDFTYAAWGACQPGGTQSRAVLTSAPAGCTGGTPITSQSCSYVPPPTCTSWDYAAWGACQPDGTQSRTFTNAYPAGCAGGAPALTQGCTYTASTGTDVQAGAVYGTWSPSGSPYRILGDVYIPRGQTLTVLPGVEVRFQGHYRMEGPGRIDARGTSPAQRDILFTAEDHASGWYGLRLWKPGANCAGGASDAPDVGDYYLQNVVVEYVVKDRSRPRAFGDTSYNDSRGALYVLGCSQWSTSCASNHDYCGLTTNLLHLDGSLFQHNRALSTSSPVGGGAAIYFNSTTTGSQPTWQDMAFDDNQSTAYGAVFTQHHGGPLTFKNCSLTNNAALGDPGGVPGSGAIGYWDVSGPVTLDTCTLTHDTPAGFATAGAPDVIVK